MTNDKSAILVVDDNPTNLRLLMDYLEATGFEVLAAEDGEVALELLQYARPDLILLDVMMPKIDGFETCRRVKDDPQTKDIPVIFMTALSETASKVKGFKTGAVDYITKPFQQEEVLARVKTHLALHRLQQELQEKNHQLQRAKEAVEAANVALSTANRRMQDELTLAREIQQSLLPPPNPNWPDLDVICYSLPAHEIGGDFYCYHAFNQIGHPNSASQSSTSKYALAVGDVSGKGVSAALLMAASLAQFDATLTQPFTPVERLLHLDRAISPYTQPRHQNCAMGYLEIELIQDRSGLARLYIVNAGCVPPYIRRQDGGITWPEVGGFTLGQGLGVEKGYQQTTVEVSRGDMIILTSDGVAEAKNKMDEMFGFERLEEMIKFGPHSSAEAMVTHLKDKLFAFMGEAEQRDDLTIVVAQV